MYMLESSQHCYTISPGVYSLVSVVGITGGESRTDKSRILTQFADVISNGDAGEIFICYLWKEKAEMTVNCTPSTNNLLNLSGNQSL